MKELESKTSVAKFKLNKMMEESQSASGYSCPIKTLDFPSQCMKKTWGYKYHASLALQTLPTVKRRAYDYQLPVYFPKQNHKLLHSVCQFRKVKISKFKNYPLKNVKFSY